MNSYLNTNDEELITLEDTDTTENEEVEETEEVAEEEHESVDELKKRLATAEAQKEHWRKKASGSKETVEAPTSTSLSNADLLAVMKANVHEDDMERVEKFAKMEGVSVKEALKNPELKAILALREENRTTANASNVSNVRRGTTKLSDDVIIANANAGKLPDDDDGINRLIAAKRKLK